MIKEPRFTRFLWIMRNFENSLYFIFILFFNASCSHKNHISSIEIKKLGYPSASSIEYLDGKLYIMGDDATSLLVLDTSLNTVDSIPIISNPDRRIQKEIKPDLESSALYYDNRGSLLFLFGSGSLSPYRNSGFLYHFETGTRDTISLESLYSQIGSSGINEVNIEGATFVSDKLILVNRGNKGYPENHLIITNEKFRNNDSSFQFSVIPFSPQKDTASFNGISGLCYAKQTDQLIMTVSTEDTRNSYDDGAIGKSYLWIINNVSDKLNNKTIAAGRVVDLEKIDSRFKGQKIESATVINESIGLIQLAMVADNDDGSSTVFRMSIKKN